jgi:hypothetical protein
MGSEGRARPVETVDEVLAGARVPTDEYAGYDAGAARRRIAQRVAGTLWMSALSLDSRAQWVRTADGGAVVRAGGACEAPPLPPPTPCPTWHEQAARDLRALSRLVVADADAASRMARLVNSRHIDPEGALVFACLLHLAGREEAAQFWWQFAAGAGNATSAQCLVLLHMGHGEQRDAEHWAVQTAELRSGPEAGEEPARSVWGSFGAGVRAVPPLPGSGGSGGPDAGVDGLEGVDGLDGVLAVVDRLEFEGDADFGTIPKPDPHLADELQELGAP